MLVTQDRALAPAHATVSPEGFAARFTAIVDSVERVIRGKREVVELALICLLAEGHLLIEDVPGVGKTTLARSLSATIGGRLQRIQFTPDLLPSDVVGVSIFHPATGAFQFHPGPVFGNIVLGDEINRASPKTQSALLEVMEERRVTVDGHAHPVPRPFMVIATQNPIEMGGTYPLPEAQLDRFLMRLAVGYPDHSAEVSVLLDTRTESLVDTLPWATTSPTDIAAMVERAGAIHVAPPLFDYIVHLVAATRAAEDVRLGASPRASVALLRAVRVRAAAHGRAYAIPADVKTLAVSVLAHRLVLTSEAELHGRTNVDVITDVVSTVPVPTPQAPAHARE